MITEWLLITVLHGWNLPVITYQRFPSQLVCDVVGAASVRGVNKYFPRASYECVEVPAK